MTNESVQPHWLADSGIVQDVEDIHLAEYRKVDEVGPPGIIHIIMRVAPEAPDHSLKDAFLLGKEQYLSPVDLDDTRIADKPDDIMAWTSAEPGDSVMLTFI